MLFNSNAPQYNTLLAWINDKKIKKISYWKLFPLKDPDTWIRKKHNKYYSRIDLSKIRKELDRDLIDPLFKRKGINVKYEANPYEHREDNLYCCFEATLKDLKAIQKKGFCEKFEKVLYRLKSNCYKIAPEAFKPFSLFLNSSVEYPGIPNKLKEEYRELEEKRDKIVERMEELQEELLKNEYRIKENQIEEIEDNYSKSIRKYSSENKNIEDTIFLVNRILKYLKTARGKPGRRPKPFNVFVYHIINKCTSWKLDKDRKYIYREDGQHKLERDFISKHKKTPAKEALKELTIKLRDIYGNFPGKDGWPFQKRIYETGFRKLIIKNGKLAIVRL